MSVVHLAHDEVLGRPVAVKILAEHLRGDAELRARFLREGQFAAALSHPNVVGVYDTGEEDDSPYIVMEYVDGVTLGDELRARGGLPPEDVVALGRQAAAGLAHAHAAGLVHRDVKPHNLLLRGDGLLKVADFGIARGGPDGTLTEAGTLLGTAAYMAPELIRGEHATPASDLYSLGAVLYELLTGRPPRRVESFADLGDARPIPHPDRLVPGLPAGLVATIMRCLDVDPERRPGSAAELASELEAPDAASTRITYRDFPVQRTRPSRGLWVAVVGGLAATAFVVALTLGGGDDPPRTPARVQPVPTGSTPAEDAQNLSRWLRANSG